MKKVLNRQKILSQIADAEKQLTSLHQQQKEIEATIQSLRECLEYDNSEKSGHPIKPCLNHAESRASLTPEDKITLFHSLFQGRADVYPKLWINKRTGKKGYSPACAKEWVRGVCEKPRVIGE